MFFLFCEQCDFLITTGACLEKIYECVCAVCPVLRNMREMVAVIQTVKTKRRAAQYIMHCDYQSDFVQTDGEHCKDF